MIDYVNIMYLINNLTDTQKQSFNVVINGVTVIPYSNILDYFKYNYSQYKSVHSKNSTNLLTTLHIICCTNQRKMNAFIMH